MNPALLIFEKDETKRLLQNVDPIKDTFSEIVVIDSSSEEEYNFLVRNKPKNMIVYHLAAIGYPDPLRSFALKLINADYVMYIDADETISETLKQELPNLNGFDVYFIPRIQDTDGRTCHQARLFKKDKILFPGYIHDTPIVLGTTCRLPESCCIIHHMETDHLENRAQRYFELEFFERPEPSRIAKLLGRNRANRLPFVLIPIFFARELILKFLRVPIEWGYPIRQELRYMVAKYLYVYSQSNQRFEHALQISQEIRRAGGPTKYLQLDDPSVVNAIDQYSKRSNLVGSQLFVNLLLKRYYCKHKSLIECLNQG
jgi:glycosyltransferase involved in cell wall biosynthesis